MLASWYFADNEPDEGLPYAEEAMELANALGNTSLASMARFALGGALMVRDPQRARQLLLESVELGRQVGNDFFVGMALGRDRADRCGRVRSRLGTPVPRRHRCGGEPRRPSQRRHTARRARSRRS